MGVCYGVFSYVSRLLWKQYLKKKLQGAEKRSLLIVTTSDRMTEVVNHIREYSLERFRIAMVVTVDGRNEQFNDTDIEQYSGEELQARNNVYGMIDGIPVVAGSRDTAENICREWVDEAFIHVPQGEDFPERLVNQLMEMGVVVHINLSETYNSLGQKMFMERIGMYNVLTSSINYATTGQLFLKRLLDIVVGVIGCMLTMLLTIVIGPIIYLKSPGPIFFTQTRVGKNGKKFKMYKFRSMYLDAEERKAELMKENRVQDGMMFKLEYDPRIIGSKKMPDGTIKKGIGNFIRDYSLDEFPQFWNVLKGDMSLVGTRPPTVDEWDKYDLHHRVRLTIKPGVTGLWQVSGRSNITDFEEVVKLDSKYITEWDIGMDLRILAKTLGVVFGKDGAM